MTNKQKLELTWIGKEKRPRLEPRIFLEERELSYQGERKKDTHSDNLLIKGDNLLALKALEQEFTGKVKCIYIDPPYNTGSAFEQYEDGLEHSTWLSLIRSRIELLWSLLDPNEGSLWVSIDDNEMPYLRVLMDEICGRTNFIASNVWQKRYSRENREAIGDVHEYILVYAKNRQVFKKIRNKVPLNEEQAKVYRNPNNDPKGRWRTIPLTAQAGHATASQFYEIISPTGKVFTPPEGRCWGLAESTFLQLQNEGKIWFGKDGNSQPNLIRYLSEVEGVTPWTWWPSSEVGHTDESKKEQHAIYGKKGAFDTPKPERLIERIIHIATNPGDLVLDSFAGSGTTGAVAHKMGRRWIMVELGEHCDTHIVPRLKKVIDGEDQGGISKAVNWQGGGGFRYLRLAPSLLQKDEWGNWIINKEYNAEMLSAAMCKHMGFTYAPSETQFWNHGYSTETDFIYVTTGSLAYDQLKRISEDVGEDRTLLICCKAFMSEGADFPNLTIKKIPQSILNKCEWDNDDYSFTLNVLAEEDIELYDEEEEA
ncbi:site-specific DNA-methyltransferase [Vibrio cholerae]|nr:site-specific DNA-methyltransferase [Vibrio cholerae]ELE0380194.1 site-specific DNA-methyltransferase [Vibrio cholerae]ELE0388120.1 site-specific DNA-methyltransferase [Vibrio cholerae]